jgi:soluble lytic murein transglycosylase
MEKRLKKTLPRTLGYGRACAKLALVLILFLPAPFGFKMLPLQMQNGSIRNILRTVEVRDKPRPKELVKVYSIVKSHRSDISDSEAWRMSEVILEESSKRSIDPLLVLAVIQVESGFQYALVSPVGARGIMQIMPDTGKFLARVLGREYGFKAAAFRPESLDDPLFNIRLGVYYLHDLRKQFESVNLALTAYNVGPAEIQNRLENNLELSDDFAAIVLEAYQRYKRSKTPTF